MAFHLWWQAHDGMTGHVFLRNEQMAALRAEMLAQGMLCGDQGGLGIPTSKLEKPHNQFISPIELDDALGAASPRAMTLEDGKLWEDFLAFLEGAAEHGGLRVKP
jgi:hypothetical protein